MKKTRLGKFQELILMTVIVLEDDAYGWMKSNES